MNAKPKGNAPWTAREDAIIRIISPEMAAAKLGRTVEAVKARRQELGLSEHKVKRRGWKQLLGRKRGNPA